MVDGPNKYPNNKFNIVILSVETVPLSSTKTPLLREICQFSWIVYSGSFKFGTSFGSGYSHSRSIHKEKSRIIDAREIHILPEYSHIDFNMYREYTNAVSLKEALSYFDAYVHKHFVSQKKSFYLLTDSDWDIKYVLHQELLHKYSSKLPDYFHKVFHLRTEFLKKYSLKPESLQYMATNLGMNEPFSISCALDECYIISRILDKMILDGYSFSIPETISFNKEIDITQSTCVRLSGIPPNVTISDIIQLFPDIAIPEGNILITFNKYNQYDGYCYILLTNSIDSNTAVSKSKYMLGSSTLNIVHSHKIEFERCFNRLMYLSSQIPECVMDFSVLPKFNCDFVGYKPTQSKKSYYDPYSRRDSKTFSDKYCIKVSNLPELTSVNDIINFFFGININHSNVRLEEEKGQITAYIDLNNEKDVLMALERQRSPFGTRYLVITDQSMKI